VLVCVCMCVCVWGGIEGRAGATPQQLQCRVGYSRCQAAASCHEERELCGALYDFSKGPY